MEYASCTVVANLLAKISRKIDAHDTIEADLSVFSLVLVDLVRVADFSAAFSTVLASHTTIVLIELL